MDPKKKRSHNSGVCVSLEKKTCIDMFDTWSSDERVDFLCSILCRMSHLQQSQLNNLLEPLLKRDFIVAFRSYGVPHLAEFILTQLDAASLLAVELVSRGWQWSVAKYQLWRRLIMRHLAEDPVWHGLADRRGWSELVYLSDPFLLPAALEKRRISMGIRQKLFDFPLAGDSISYRTGPNCTSESEGRCHITDQACRCHSGVCGNRSSSQQADSSLDTVHACLIGSRDHIADTLGPHTDLPTSPASAGSFESPGWRLQTGTSFTLDVERNDTVSYDAIMFAHRFYKQLYPRIIREIKRVENNWTRGNYHLTRIPCRSDETKGVYCLQYDNEKIVSGLRDDTIKVWRRFDSSAPQVTQTGAKSKISPPARPIVIPRDVAAVPEVDPGSDVVEQAAPVDPVDHAPPAPRIASTDVGADGYHCTQVLEGHTGSVLCLQYIGNLLISGSSDTSVRLWDLASGLCLNVINHHSEAVLHLRFRNNVLVTCSKDRSIAVWDMGPSPRDVQLRQVLVGHRAAVNVVDFDDKYIVSASGDRTIKVWDSDTCAHVRTLTGHRRGIACLQYCDRLVVSGSSDNTIRIWDAETGVCFRVLEGHEELVRCIRFNSKYIVSGAYDGKIKVWSLKHAIDPRSKPSQLCLHTLQQHTGRVFRLQFDDFQIVSSSHDDTILIWDFVRPAAGNIERDDGFDDGIHTAPASKTGGLHMLPSTSNTRSTAAHHVQEEEEIATCSTTIAPAHPRVPPPLQLALPSSESPRSHTSCVEMENEEPTRPPTGSNSQSIPNIVPPPSGSSTSMRRSGVGVNRTPSNPGPSNGNDGGTDHEAPTTPTSSSSTVLRNLYPDT